MNFLSQLYENKSTYPHSLNFYLKPDHFSPDSLTSRPRRHRLLIGNVADNEELIPDPEVSSRHYHHLPSNDICLKDLDDSSSLPALPRNSVASCNRHSVNDTSSAVGVSEAEEPLLVDEKVDRKVDKKLSSGLTSLRSRYSSQVLGVQHDCQREGCQRITINISGLRFETQLRTLDRLPNTLLGDPEKRRRYWDEERQEFFFDRHRPSFQAVLYFYQSGGRLTRPVEVPVDIFLNELQFYELGDAVVDAFKRREGYIVESPPVLPINPILCKIWTALEYPDSSLVARVIAVLSVLFIVMSTITFCIETLPAFQESGCVRITGANGTQQVPNLGDPLFLTESCCILWFVLEFALRFVTSPSKLHFLISAVTWIDVATIFPYFVFVFVTMVTGACQTSHGSSFLSALRVLRVVRILKLSKHSQGLKILGMTFRTSLRELFMFAIFLGIATLIYSAGVYYAEKDERHSQFSSIPDAFWWAIVTMTTVGYGDFVPVGPLGKILGSFCALSGVLAIALPVPVIVANFNNYYCHYAGTREF